MPTTERERSHVPPAGYFATTHWSVVLKARGKSSSEAGEALESLCKTYWYPLYAYIRRQGHGPQDAQDLTQSFFARFLEKDYLGDVQRERGKFRSFLLASLKHFLANEWDRARAKKRGAGQTFISLDEETSEGRYRLEPQEEMTAERIYERRWALTLLDQVLARLREEFAAAGKADQFESLKVFLSAGTGSIPYADVAAQLSSTPEAIKVAVHRLRKRYRGLLRAEIAHTVGRPEEVDEEIRCLFRALSG